MRICRAYTMPENRCRVYYVNKDNDDTQSEGIDKLFQEAIKTHPELKREDILMTEDMRSISFPVAYIPLGFNPLEKHPKKTLLVADFVQHSDKKEKFIIKDADSYKTLFEGRNEYLEYTAEGESHELCGREVEWFEGIFDGQIILYVK